MQNHVTLRLIYVELQRRFDTTQNETSLFINYTVIVSYHKHILDVTTLYFLEQTPDCGNKVGEPHNSLGALHL